eukprot:COSAG06_NODE_3893_length_4797_cov_4.554066_2_plen_148_part_00
MSLEPNVSFRDSYHTFFALYSTNELRTYVCTCVRGHSVFFFDIFLPADYPNTPPSVSYFSYGERLNPNLYETGKVCLSLLGTWSGEAGENWNPQSSNILQVLISIQGLVLVEEPFYNEPGFEKQIGTEDGRGEIQRSGLRALPQRSQ